MQSFPSNEQSGNGNPHGHGERISGQCCESRRFKAADKLYQPESRNYRLFSRCAGRGDLVGDKNFEPLPLEPRLIMAQAMKTALPPAVLLENPAPPGGVFLWERGLAKRVHLRLAQPNRLIDCRAMIRGFSPGVQGRFVQSRSCRVRRF